MKSEDVEREARQRRFCRDVATMIARAMGESDTSFAQIDARLAKKSGWSRRFVIDLLEGVDKELRPIAEVAWACGGASIDISVFRPPTPPTVNSGDKK